MTESITMTLNEVNPRVFELKIAWIAASNGSLTAEDTNLEITGKLKGWSCFLGITDPGSTAPTDNYNVSVKDAYGVDIFGGELDNRDTANSEQAVPLMDVVYGARLVNTALTFDVTGNSVDSATGDVYLYFERGW